MGSKEEGTDMVSSDSAAAGELNGPMLRLFVLARQPHRPDTSKHAPHLFSQLHRRAHTNNLRDRGIRYVKFQPEPSVTLSPIRHSLPTLSVIEACNPKLAATAPPCKLPHTSPTPAHL